MRNHDETGIDGMVEPARHLNGDAALAPLFDQDVDDVRCIFEFVVWVAEDQDSRGRSHTGCYRPKQRGYTMQSVE